MEDQNVVLTMHERWHRMMPSERDAVSALHVALQCVKQYPERYSDPVQFIEDTEFTLQGLWKFSRDTKFHTHWIDIKGCTCPKMDNADGVGGGKITRTSCKWHGTAASAARI